MAKAKKKATPRPRRSKLPASAAFVKMTQRSVRSVFTAAEDIPTFLATAGTLTAAERLVLVDQALVLLEENYVHLPLKRAMHATNPVQALKVLKHRIESEAAGASSSEAEFHATMLSIFASVRDLHTNYLLPAPFNSRTAFMPFDIEEFFTNSTSRYLVTHTVSGFSHPHFVEGVEVTAWSGVPIERAVAVNAERHAGSNPAARHARGVEFLTLRPMVRSLPPDEQWVEVAYIDLDGTSRTMRQDWLVFEQGTGTSGVATDVADGNAASLGLDIELDAATQAKRLLYAPGVVAATTRAARLTKRPAEAGAEVPTALPEVLRARSVVTASGTFGHLRIFSFNVNDPDDFVAEVERLIGLLPQDGLIIDVRGNGGGHIYASEGLLQLFTAAKITPQPTQFISSPLNRRICHRHRNNPVGIDLKPWLGSLDEALETSAVYSTGHPITPAEFANSRGQRYGGPVILITDARCYSATDIFAAGFQDHEIGLILGADDNTGAGGANVWTHELLSLLMQHPTLDAKTPYTPLPKGADMRVAIRRTLRVGAKAGTPLEDLGVEPDERWMLTRQDLLNGNVDLLDRAGELLANQTVHVLEAVAQAAVGGQRPIEVTTDNFGRLDIYVDGRPFGSRNVNQGTTEISVPATASSVELRGLSGTTHVVTTRVTL